ncbi:MAG: CYTH and CHAD domain-containing protein [Propioniciclava sp.]|uniref:CYTH and CHAD domain-containing protein n=1 Tax=Propioniciclava sp. TaxID=2038686 RepID=UPI0039E6DBCD
MAERTIERELKFAAPEGFDPDLSAVVERLGEERFRLEAVYHDTLGLTLTDAGWGLRRRSGGKDAGWHLKRPAGEAGARTEVWAPDADSVPQELRQEVREITGLDALVPVVRLVTDRVETLLGIDGVPLATLVRDEVSAVAASGTTAWREIEVELEPGADPSLLARLADALTAAGAEPAGHGSKLARAMAQAARFSAPASPQTPARAVLLAWMATQVGVLQSREADVRANAPDAVHKSRVATRRLRSLLKTFAPLFDKRRAKALRAELKWLADLLGHPRDAEVLAEAFETLMDELGPDAVTDTVRRRLLGHLAEQHARAHAALMEGLDSPRAQALRRALIDTLVDPPLRSETDAAASAVLPPLFARAKQEVASLREHALADPDHLERWHEVRKAAKAARYAAEALDCALHTDGEIERWEAVTESFGQLQDTAVALELIDVVAADASSEEQPAWQALRDAEHARRVAALAEGQSALDAALARVGGSALRTICTVAHEIS